MTNGEQMFWGRQSGSFFPHTWALAPREWLSCLGSHTGPALQPALGSAGVRDP